LRRFHPITITLARIIIVGAGAMRTTLDPLGMPLTNIVGNVHQLGKLVTGSATNKFMG